MILNLKFDGVQVGYNGIVKNIFNVKNGRSVVRVIFKQLDVLDRLVPASLHVHGKRES